MIVKWHSDVYRNFRRKITDMFGDHLFEQESIRLKVNNILREYNAEIIELRHKSPVIREVTDSLGINDRYAIQFNNEEDYLLFVLKWS